MPRLRRLRIHPSQRAIFERGSFESLESRRVNSVTPELVIDLDERPVDGIGRVVDVGSTGVMAVSFGDERHLWRTGGTEQTTYRLGEVLLSDTRIYSAGTLAYFIGRDHRGTELWRTDGTTAGTMLVRDISSEDESHSTDTHFDTIIPLSNHLIFSTRNEIDEVFWWSTDRTGTSAQMLLHPDKGEPLRLTVARDSITIPLSRVVGEMALLAIGDDPDEIHVWQTDGTQENTRQMFLSDELEDVAALLLTGNVSRVDGKYFFRDRSDEEARLWKTDGTLKGTELANEYDTIIGVPRQFERLVYYFKSAAPNPPELWLRTDKGEFPIASGGPVLMNRIDTTTILMRLRVSPTAIEIWKTDGSASGTQRLARISSNSIGGTSLVREGVLYFLGTSLDGESQGWRSDGTVEGTGLVLSSTDELVLQQSAGWVNDTYYVFGRPLGTGGSASLFSVVDFGAAPRPVLTVPVTTESSNPSYLTPFQEDLYFRAGAENFFKQTQLWKTDGTSAGTVLLYDSEMLGLVQTELMPHPLVTSEAHDGLVFFGVVIPQTQSYELWASDGSARGTVKIDSVSPNFRFEHIRTIGGRVFYVKFGRAGYQLWQTDGTVRGTRLVAGLPSDATDLLNMFRRLDLWPLGDKLNYITTRLDGDRQPIVELWREGQATPERIDENVARLWRVSTTGTVLGSHQLFLDFDRETGIHLWRTDNTAKNMVLVRTVASGPLPDGLQERRQMISNGKSVLFTVSDGVNTRLWVTDGTSTGTHPLEVPGLTGPIREWVRFGDLIVFPHFSLDRDPGEQWQLWRSDGTESGTFPIELGDADLLQTTPLVRNLNGRPVLIWTIANRMTMSDGTRAGTRTAFVFDQPVFGMEVPQLTEFGGQLFFIRRIGDVRELWRTDGTPEGTERVQSDLGDQEYWSPAPYVVPTSSRLFFVSDGVAGRELWKLEPLVGDANLDGQVDFDDFLTLSANFGKVEAAVWSQGDFDFDQDVDFADFLLLSQNYGKRR